MVSVERKPKSTNATKPADDSEPGAEIWTPEGTTPATAPLPAANPIPVGNPYRKFYDQLQDGYLLPDSDRRYYFHSEGANFERDFLRLARNEIFARRGYVFNDANLAEYFSAMPWYNPVPNQDPSKNFNKYESHNVLLLNMLQDLIDGKNISLSGKNPYLQHYNAKTEHILTYTAEDVVERYFLRGFSKEELKLARNEIFARHGYYFSDEDLLTYFALCSWYYPDPDITTTNDVHLSAQEKKNVSIIRDYEKAPDFDPSDLDTRLNYTIEADVFAVSVPAYWHQAADYYYSGDLVDFVQTASIYEEGGLLFGFMSVETLEEMEYHPSWFPVGTVSKAGAKSYYIVVIEPTDVQFNTEDANIAGQYRYMYNEMDRIIPTLRGVNGYTFTPW